MFVHFDYIRRYSGCVTILEQALCLNHDYRGKETEMERRINKRERAELLMAMDRIATCFNCEDFYFDNWRVGGIADGDIEYDGLCDHESNVTNLMNDDYYMDDDNFRDIINAFMHATALARQDGGLYCDGIVAGERGQR